MDIRCEIMVFSLSENWDLIVMISIILIYIIIATTLWIKKIQVAGFTIFPFGISTKKLNDPIDRIANRFQPFWLTIGKISYRSFGFLVIVFPLYLLFLVIFAIAGFSTVNVFLLFPLRFLFDRSELNFSSVQFWIIAFLSILIHELFHGILGRAINLEVQSVGAIALPTIAYLGYVSMDFHNYGGRKRVTDPFFTKRQEYRNDFGKVVSAGLFSNLILLIIGLFFLLLAEINVLYLPIIWLKYLIGANTTLILLNILPVPIFDGNKILKLKSQDYFSQMRAKKIVGQIDILSVIGFFVLLSA